MKLRLLLVLLKVSTLLIAPPGKGFIPRPVAPLYGIFDNKKANHLIERLAQERNFTPTLQGSLFPLELVACDPNRRLFQIAATQQGVSGRCGWHALINTISMLKLMECYATILKTTNKENIIQHTQALLDATALITTDRKTTLCDQLWPHIQCIRQALKIRAHRDEEGLILEEISHLIPRAASLYLPTQLPTEPLTSLISVAHANEWGAGTITPPWLQTLIDHCHTSKNFIHGFIILYNTASTTGFAGSKQRNPHYISVVIVKKRGTVWALITNSMPDIVINRAFIQQFVALFNQEDPASSHADTASCAQGAPRKTAL